MPVRCNGLQCLVLGIKTTSQRLYFLKSTGDFLKLQQEIILSSNLLFVTRFTEQIYKIEFILLKIKAPILFYNLNFYMSETNR